MMVTCDLRLAAGDWLPASGCWYLAISGLLLGILSVFLRIGRLDELFFYQFKKSFRKPLQVVFVQSVLRNQIFVFNIIIT